MKLISLVVFSILTMFIISACNQETPVAQQPQSLYSEDDAVALYMIGNEDPIEADRASNFLFHGPGPFFLWALDLTDEQKSKLHEIGEAHRAEMRDHFKGSMRNGDREAMKEEHAKLREEMMGEIWTILTDEQKAVLDEIQNQIDNGQYPTIIIEKRVASLTEKLNLTEAQQEDFRKLMADYGAKLLQIRNMDGEPRELHQASREILQEYKEAFKALLDEDQLAAFEEMKANFRADHPRHHQRGFRH